MDLVPGLSQLNKKLKAMEAEKKAKEEEEARRRAEALKPKAWVNPNKRK